MKAYRKIMFVMLLALVACSALSIFAGPASAALKSQGSISTDNPSVGENAAYTLILTNIGSDSLLSANITVPVNNYWYVLSTVKSEFTNIRNLAVTPSSWTVQDIEINGTRYLNLVSSGEGLVPNKSVTITFDATNPRVAGTYQWAISAVGTDGTTQSEVTLDIDSPIRITTVTPVFILLGIAFGVSFLSLVFNRLLIARIVGWEQYQVMRREMSEFQKAQMAAARANDVKQMEKLKRKQTQINNMQAKMFKTTLLQFGFMVVPWLIWGFVLIPTYGDTSLAYLPGLGGIPMFWLYFPLSLFASTLGQRIIGLNPLEYH